MKISDFFSNFFSKEAIQKYVSTGLVNGPLEDATAIISLKRKTDMITGAPIQQVVVRMLLRNTLNTQKIHEQPEKSEI